ncbi:MAG TPA: tRNA 2-thiouridine(34) synthase MnmA [Candidatus Dormibacteraeota bacterium]|nr:tRNA 2-thiouridine(34) synthase MnmA [Candidatus Dormibacteraeota bacterium]
MSALGPAPAPAIEPALLPDDPLDLLPAGAVVAVAMSGGVDSSVAAARCAARGLRTIGITLAMWPRSRQVERDRGCCSLDAVEDARRVAGLLGIPHYAWNLEDDFRERVIRDFEDEYAAGRTPNPCVRCNERVKFGTLLDRALALGATHVATGHYAQVGRRGDALTLHRAADARKDQAYTLHRLDQRRLRHAVFPLGATASKESVRAEALRLGLPTAAKPDSQELCFVDVSLPDELSRRLRGRFSGGDIVSLEGDVVGAHRGLPFYTVGQRTGLGLRPAIPDAAPAYVVALDAARNRVVVGPRTALLRTRATAGDASWISGSAPASGTGCTVQLRAHGAAHPARVEAASGAGLSLCFDPPVAQVSPGQSMVVYRGGEVLGGGTVAEAA